MPARRKSIRIKELQGTSRPDRDKKNTPVSSNPLGPPPAHMTDQEKDIWSEISAKLPQDTASAADSLAFEVLVSLMGKFRLESLTGTELTLLMRTFAKFGLTPQDRGSIDPIPPKEGSGTTWGKPNPFDKFKK